MIYTEGRNASGQTLEFRLFGAGDNLIPANGIVCAKCHGADGRGGTDGSIVMADIRHATLSRRLRASAKWHRARVPYTDALLARAIEHGIDSSGNRLTAVMPRWVLSDSELKDLLAYLKQLGRK